MLGDYPDLPMPTLESEITLVEIFSKSKVIGIAVNHENMTENEVTDVIEDYEIGNRYVATDVLTHGPKKLVGKILFAFPELEAKIRRNSGEHPLN